MIQYDVGNQVLVLVWQEAILEVTGRVVDYSI